MGKNLEKKIQEEIRKRVMEEEEFLPEKVRQGEPVKIEALSIVTYLPREDVARIAKSVRDEFDKKRFSRKWVRIFSALLIMGVIAFAVISYLTSEETGFTHIIRQSDTGADTGTPYADTSKSLLDEPFDNNRKGWFVGEAILYKGAIKSGSYTFEGLQDYCFGDRIALKFPDRYMIEVTSTWKSGKYDLYGFSISQDSGRGYVFPLKGNGAATYAPLYDGKPKFEEPWYSDMAKPGDGKVSNVQRVEISGSIFKYFLNGKLFRKDSVLGMNLSDIVIHCCGKQKVEFNNLKVTALNDYSEPGKTILNEPFKNSDAGWHPETIFSRQCYLKNGQYIFSTGAKSACNWSSVQAVAKGNYDIRLSSFWRDGDQGEYGLVLINDDKNYFAFEIRNNGTARYICLSDGEVRTETEWKKAGNAGGKCNTQRVAVRGSSFKYYVNNILVENGDMQGLKMNRVGVKVCGKQTVAFDHLGIKPQ